MDLNEEQLSIAYYAHRAYMAELRLDAANQEIRRRDELERRAQAIAANETPVPTEKPKRARRAA